MFVLLSSFDLEDSKVLLIFCLLNLSMTKRCFSGNSVLLIKLFLKNRVFIAKEKYFSGDFYVKVKKNSATADSVFVTLTVILKTIINFKPAKSR